MTFETKRGGSYKLGEIVYLRRIFDGVYRLVTGFIVIRSTFRM